MTDPETLEMFTVGDIHVTICREIVDSAVSYWATFQTNPNDDAVGRFEFYSLDDLATAASAADAVIAHHRGLIDTIDTARQLARLGLVPTD